MTVGIYALYWEEQDLIYIGQSQNIEARYREHLYKMKNTKHTNYKVQNTFDLYGEPILQILQECSIENCNELEIYYTREFDSINNGLNIIEAGLVGWGVNSNASKYTKWQILKAFSLLYRTKLSTRDIAKRCKVNIGVVHGIQSGTTHIWLKAKYAEKFNLIKDRLQTVFLNRSYKASIHSGKEVKVINPKGEIVTIQGSLSLFARNNNLTKSHFCKVVAGELSQHKGWKKA